ncbi:Gfo/Idh/MocA family oxidoreductase [candidate division WOR-3 bacterium]|nr:Gfo/Idh/MocA family oxidoreductase [candidate division WOR-3 bacterium]
MIKLGLIGCGHWGPNLLRNFAGLKNVYIESVCDLRNERLEYVKQNYPYLKSTTDYKELIESPKINAIVIATSASTHYNLAKEALKAGKHVLIEKPLAMYTNEAMELVKVAKQKGKVLMVGHTFLYNAAVRVLKDYIKRGELGNIYYVYSQRLNLGIVRNDINAMWNLAPHDISILLYLFDSLPISVSAKGAFYLQKDIEDIVFMTLTFSKNIIAHIHVSWLDPNKVRKMTVVGNKKMIVYDDVSENAKIQVYDKGITKKSIKTFLGEYDTFAKFQLIKRAGDVLLPKVAFAEPLKVECSHFIECIELNKKPLTDGENGVEVVKVLESAQESLKSKGREIPILN